MDETSSNVGTYREDLHLWRRDWSLSLSSLAENEWTFEPRQTNKQTDRQRDTHTDRQTDRQLVRQLIQMSVEIQFSNKADVYHCKMNVNRNYHCVWLNVPRHFWSFQVVRALVCPSTALSSLTGLCLAKLINNSVTHANTTNEALQATLLAQPLFASCIPDFCGFYTICSECVHALVLWHVDTNKCQ